MKRIGLRVYRLLYFIPAAVLLLLLGLTNEPFRHTSLDGVPKAIAAVLVVWLIVGRWIARWLLPLVISTLRCPGCDEELDCVKVWNCGCGYHDHRERHVLGFACPKCGKTCGHVDCPRCDATILLW